MHRPRSPAERIASTTRPRPLSARELNILTRALRAATIAATLVILCLTSAAAAGAVDVTQASAAKARCGKSHKPGQRKCQPAHKKKSKHKKKKHKPKRPTKLPPPGNTVQSITAWKQNAAVVGWSAATGRVIYNSIGSDGMFDAYSSNPDGSDPECLTCTIPSFAGVGTSTNRGASDVSPDGRYMLVTVENGTHLGSIGASWTQPGKGGANNVWLYTTDGTQAWPLTNIDAASQWAYGTIWPRFDRTGNEIVWASMYAPALLNLGYWQLKTASLAWSGGVPSLAGVRTIEPAPRTFYEPYGFTPDDSRIIFASNAGTGPWIDSQIDTIATDGTGLSQLTQPGSGTILNYNEFAFYTPGDRSIIYGSTRDSTAGGLDYWIMNPSGNDRRRLTFFNQPWSTETLGYSIVEGLAFNPANPNQFITGVATDLSSETINAQLVTLNASTSAGLTQRFYSGQSFGQLLATATQNPSDGFDADSAPAPGIPATNYSIKWTGSVVPPASGKYVFCLVAYPGGSLQLRGQQFLDVWNSHGRRGCIDATVTAGTPVPIEIDYAHGSGPAYAQLSWIPPGTPTPTLIPSSALRP